MKAGSAESRNFDNEFVAVVAKPYCAVGCGRLNGDGLFLNRIARSWIVSTTPGGVLCGRFGCVGGREASTDA